MVTRPHFQVVVTLGSTSPQRSTTKFQPNFLTGIFVSYSVYETSELVLPVRKLGWNLVVLRCGDVEPKVTTAWKRGRVTTKVKCENTVVQPRSTTS